MRNRHPKRLRRAAAAAAVALALALAWSAGSARAEDADDDENVPLDSKIFRQFMKDLGLKREGDAMIDYRERAPLVVPPSRDLPPPRDEAEVAAKAPGASGDDQSRPMMPSDLGTKTEKIFGSIWSSFTPAKPESAPFTGEPPREAMTAPPAGYQTPSPNYPYGMGVQDKRKISTQNDKLEGRQ